MESIMNEQIVEFFFHQQLCQLRMAHRRTYRRTDGQSNRLKKDRSFCKQAKDTSRCVSVHNAEENKRCEVRKELGKWSVIADIFQSNVKMYRLAKIIQP